MFTNEKRQAERTGKYGTPRQQHLQQLVTQFQNPTISQDSKDKIVANLANFAYDPFNYPFLRDLNVLELFIDCLTEPSERLIEFATAITDNPSIFRGGNSIADTTGGELNETLIGICNAVAAPENARIVCDCGGVPALIVCLSSPVRNTVKYAIAGLYYLWDFGAKFEIQERDDVVDLITKYSQVPVFAHLAKALLDKISQT